MKDYPEGWPIFLKPTGVLGGGWILAEWGNSAKDGRDGKELLVYDVHPPLRFNLNVACAISQEIK